ncbi:MAG: 2,3-bisphosphoglycerate-independent phosphoglycerate mutase [Candidatus Bathyarchaeota archaeon BA2]|nr:MAG: 2,3-bisphosphoglycerate-independent phosphoglycerate mutase [Candidatus Bathyarchaeota archaeon BA2]
MKLIYVVIDGMGDLPIEELGNRTPLEAADTPNMDFLAKTGKTGLMYTVGKGIASESDVAVVSILGYDPFKYEVNRGPLEALGSGLTMKDGDLALRCNFATLGYGNALIDRRVGRGLTTEEATELSKAINEKVKLESYPASFEFKSTIGHRGALVIRSKEKCLSGNISNTDPAYTRIKGIGVAEPEAEMILKKCKPMDKTEEAKISANLVNEFTEKSRTILEEHEVNKRRVAQGKLSANVILTRDAGHRLPEFFNINEQYGLRFVCLADMPIEKGISRLAGMQIVDLPPPSKSLEKDCILRVKKLLEALPSHDCFYIHIKGPDEPGHDGNFNLKTKLIAIVDRHFLGNMLQKIKLEDYVVCVTADHSTPCKLKAHSDDPVPLLISGNKIQGDEVQKFSEKECKKGKLGILERGTELMPKLIMELKE